MPNPAPPRLACSSPAPPHCGRIGTHKFAESMRTTQQAARDVVNHVETGPPSGELVPIVVSVWPEQPLVRHRIVRRPIDGNVKPRVPWSSWGRRAWRERAFLGTYREQSQEDHWHHLQSHALLDPAWLPIETQAPAVALRNSGQCPAHLHNVDPDCSERLLQQAFPKHNRPVGLAIRSNC